jgi:hypothetical protein
MDKWNWDRRKQVYAVVGLPKNAESQLKQKVRFHLICLAGLDSCIRCGKKIERAEDASLDHKQPWRGVSAGLFWSMDNIGFSHKRCNIQHQRRNHNVIAPEGMAWCSTHKAYTSIKEFQRDHRRKTGVRGICKRCRNKNLGRVPGHFGMLGKEQSVETRELIRKKSLERKKYTPEFRKWIGAKGRAKQLNRPFDVPPPVVKFLP